MLEINVGSRYKLIEHVGSGAYGHVFTAEDRNDGTRCVVKVEDRSSDNPSLKHETKILQYLAIKDMIGIPKPIRYGKSLSSRYLSM